MVQTTIIFVLTVLTAFAVLFAALEYSKAEKAERRSCEALNLAETACRNVQELEKKIPEDFQEQSDRRDLLMRDLNDELERRIQAEKGWNMMVDSILNYNVSTAKSGGENQ